MAKDISILCHTRRIPVDLILRFLEVSIIINFIDWDTW